MNIITIFLTQNTSIITDIHGIFRTSEQKNIDNSLNLNVPILGNKNDAKRGERDDITWSLLVGALFFSVLFFSLALSFSLSCRIYLRIQQAISFRAGHPPTLRVASRTRREQTPSLRWLELSGGDSTAASLPKCRAVATVPIYCSLSLSLCLFWCIMRRRASASDNDPGGS